MKKLQGMLPIIFSVSFVAIIVGLSVLKFKDLQGTMLYSSIVMVALYLLWLAVESKVAMGETKKGNTKLDSGTLEFYAMGRALVVISALAVPTATALVPTQWKSFGPWAIVGIALFVVSISFRLYAISVLGRFYSHRVRVTEGHQIINTGPYRFLRHPAYTGMIFGHLGVLIFFFNWVTLAVYACMFVPSIVARILVEEKVLFQIKGYPEYAKDRKRVVPFVW